MSKLLIFLFSLLLRHTNRDAVLAHVKIHYQDANYPIVTATATTSPKSANSQQQHNTPLQVAVNPNIYMNKVLAAMCLSQQQQPNSSTPTNNSNSNSNNDQQHSIISAGLLQQAIQGVSPNSPLGCLALSLAGKSPAKATASILEHGEQKATQNEASAQRPTSPKEQYSNNQNNISIANLATSSTTSSSPNSSGGINAIDGVGMVGTPTSASSLQHLLTSPRGTYASSSNSSLRNPVHSPTISNSNNGGSVGGVSGHTNNNNNNKNLVMGALTVMKHNSATTPLKASNDSVFGSPTSAVSTATTATDANATSSVLASPNAGAAHNTPRGTTVTTLSTTPSNSTASMGVKSANNPYHLQMGLIGASSMSNNHNVGSGSVGGGIGIGVGVIGSQMTHSDNKNSLCIGGIMFGSNNSTTTTTSTSLIRNTSIPTTTSTTTIASSPTTAGHSGGASSSSCNLLLSSAQSTTAAAAAAAAAAATTALYASNAITLSPPSASSCISANATANNFNRLTQNLNQSQNNNCSNLLVNDSERREPSPYRCGHCHQVSNWKHVIQVFLYLLGICTNPKPKNNPNILPFTFIYIHFTFF